MKKLLNLLIITLVLTLSSCANITSKEDRTYIKSIESPGNYEMNHRLTIKTFNEWGAISTIYLNTNKKYELGSNPFDNKDYQILIKDSTYYLYDNGKILGIFKPSNSLNELIIKDNE